MSAKRMDSKNDMQLTINGENIYLRPMEIQDTDRIVGWRNKDFVKKNFIFQKPFTRQGHLNWIETMVNTGKVIQFIICEKRTGRPVGSVYLRDIDKVHNKAEFGIFIGEQESAGRGYGTQAVKLILNYAFRDAGIHKVMLRVLSENERAIRSYEKAGFKQEAYLKKDVLLNGEYKDVILMAKFQDESQMKERFVIIGANEFQRPLIIRAKEKGYETHVFAWEEGAEGKGEADYFYPVDIKQKDKILEKCRELKPAGIASIGSDLAMLTVNFVAQSLKLCSNSLECTKVTTNKFSMRKAFEKHGDPSPRFALSDELQKVKEFRYPLIVKPTDRSGSRGIMKISEAPMLTEAIETASSYAFDKKAIIEEFIEGKEYSVEYISFKGRHTFLALTEKFTTGAPHFIETGHREPAEIEEETLKRIKDVVSHALDSLLVTYGASHSEVMVLENGEVMLVEIGARMGGDCIGSDLVKLSTGFDFVGMVIDAACGREPSMMRIFTPRPAAIYFIFNEDDLSRLNDRIKTNGSSIYYISPIEKFDHEITDSGSRYGYYIVYED